VRVGLVSGVVFGIVTQVLRVFPLEHPGASWYWPITAVGLVALVLVLGFGARAAMGRRAWFTFDEAVPAALPPPRTGGSRS
jgi:hypothetical protein